MFWVTTRVFILGFVALAVMPVTGHAQSDDLDALNRRADELYGQGKYVEATKLAKHGFTLTEKKFGPSHPAVGTSLNNLAVLYERRGRDAEAEPLYKRSLAIREKALGPDHPDVGTSDLLRNR